MVRLWLACVFCVATLDFAMAQSRAPRPYGASALRPVCQQFASALQAQFLSYKVVRQASSAQAARGGRSVSTVLRVGITIGSPSARAGSAAAGTAAQSFRREQRRLNRLMVRAGCRPGFRHARNAGATARAAATPRAVVISLR